MRSLNSKYASSLFLLGKLLISIQYGTFFMSPPNLQRVIYFITTFAHNSITGGIISKRSFTFRIMRPV